jgi:hypothetical protein
MSPEEQAAAIQEYLAGEGGVRIAARYHVD